MKYVYDNILVVKLFLSELQWSKNNIKWLYSSKGT